jgi:hypothetical protein
LMAIVWFVVRWMWLRVAGRSGRPGFATVVMLIRGGVSPKTFVRRTSAV